MVLDTGTTLLVVPVSYHVFAGNPIVRTITLFTAFNNDRQGRPYKSVLQSAGKPQRSVSMFMPDSPHKVRVCKERQQQVQEILLSSIGGNTAIMVNDFKRHIKEFDLPLTDDYYEVYEVPGPQLALENLSEQCMLWSQEEPQIWQKLLANAAVVYENMERTVLKNNRITEHVTWSLHTATGRSKSSQTKTGFMPQSIPVKNDCERVIHAADCGEDDLLVYLDWVSADMRMVAHLAHDEDLAAAFMASDPYTVLSEALDVTRSECKPLLLKAVHGHHPHSPIFKVFPKLRDWVNICRRAMEVSNGYLSSILGRQFYVADIGDKALSYIIQGSTAHAMHAAIRQIWELPGVKILSDMHDGLVLTIPTANSELLPQIGMGFHRPFAGLALESELENFEMPLQLHVCKVSEGWRSWKPRFECRNGQFKRLKQQ